MNRPRLLLLDAFAKTVEDARVRTALGGVITLVCVLVVLFLIRNEYHDYTLVVVRPELAVDRDVNTQLQIDLDIVFPHVPCGVLTLDILDVLGDLRLDVLQSGFQLFRVLANGHEVPDDTPLMSGMKLADDLCRPVEGEPCGPCYGALKQDDNSYCCNTCEAVRVAYAAAEWAFYDGENIEQCEREGYVQRMKQRIADSEGCRVAGQANINRIAGNLHFAPGVQLTKLGVHTHDLSLWLKYPDKFSVDHEIRHFSFDRPPREQVPASLATEALLHPLDGLKFAQGRKHHVALYFLQVVATRLEFLLGARAYETNQFLVITHDRPIHGGRDDDHPNSIHARGGVPGVYFHFEISPMKIINREQYAKTWLGFVLGVVSAIAGVLTVGAVLDRSVFAAEQLLRGKKDI